VALTVMTALLVTLCVLLILHRPDNAKAPTPQMSLSNSVGQVND
jgi:hypothetical protein